MCAIVFAIPMLPVGITTIRIDPFAAGTAEADVPEPSTAILIGCALITVASFVRRARKPSGRRRAGSA
jgi:hypothetical protein